MIYGHVFWKTVTLPAMLIVSTHTVIVDGKLYANSPELKKLEKAIPTITVEMAEKIKSDFYGFLPIREPTSDKTGVGIFQTQTDGDFDLEIAQKSTSMLNDYVRANKAVNYRIAYPGEISSTPLEILPDNVEVVLTQTEFVHQVSIKDYAMRLEFLLYENNIQGAASLLEYFGSEDPTNAAIAMRAKLVKKRREEKAKAREMRQRRWDNGEHDIWMGHF